eukprot:scaffold4761_cov205-Amphora_coffeaeformis.AAC.8
MAAVRGTIHDNPWAGVEPLRGDEESQGHNDNSSNNERRRMILKEGFLLQALDLVMQISMCLDGCLGIFFVVFGLVLHHKHRESIYAIVWVLVLGNFLLIRAKGVAMGLFLPTDSLWSCYRGGLTVAGYLSLGLAVFHGGCAILGLAFRPNVRHYLQTAKLDLTATQTKYLVKHYTAIIVILAFLALLEAAKFQIYIIYRRSILVLEEEDERLEEQDLIRRQAASGRPWWWSSSAISRHGRRYIRHHADGGLTESLLGDESEQRSPRRRRGFLFLWPLRRRTGVDVSRDDGSVDFASVQEEWASRAEEDPVWWSREDDDGDEPRSPSRSTAVDTSWANDTSQASP